MQVLRLIGHIEVPSQDIATLMDGIAEAMSEEEIEEQCEDEATNQKREDFTASSTFAPVGCIAWREDFGRLCLLVLGGP